MTTEQRRTIANAFGISDSMMRDLLNSEDVDPTPGGVRLTKKGIERITVVASRRNATAERDEIWKERRSATATRMCRALRRTERFLESYTSSNQHLEAARKNILSEIQQVLSEDYAF